MQRSAGDAQELSPEQGWQDIHTTMESLRGSMYVAGTAAILLVWGAIISLGYILFGIMHSPIIAVIGVGIAAAFYVPSFLAEDAAPLMSDVLTLGVVAVGWALIRRSGVL